MRDLPIVAIDPADARDHDDAIWAKPDGKGGYDAVVAIADVSFYVRPGSALDREARKRGNSVYFPDRVVPMLPEVLSADVCSLREGEDRAAMACHLHIDKAGKVETRGFTRAIVRIHHNIAYEDAQAAADGGDAPEHLAHLWGAWKLLAAARAKRDPLELELPERRVVLGDDGRIEEIAVRERLDAHRVVEDFMIAANVAAAKALEAKTAPVVYRVHEQPSREKLIALRDYLDTMGRKLALGQVVTPGLFNRMLKDLTDETERAQVMEAVLRTQMQAYYGPANAGHFGLALGSYAHFTSRSAAMPTCWSIARWSMHTGWSSPRRQSTCLVRPACRTRTGPACRRCRTRSAPPNGARWRRNATRSTATSRHGWPNGWARRSTRGSPASRASGFFATISGLGGDGLVPVSSLGDEYFRYDEAAQKLVGEHSGTTYAPGDRLQLKLAESNPLTGALRFAVIDEDGNAVEERGGRSDRRGRGGSDRKSAGNGQGKQAQGRYAVGKRGRPGNIRHQGRRKGPSRNSAPL